MMKKIELKSLICITLAKQPQAHWMGNSDPMTTAGIVMVSAA